MDAIGPLPKTAAGNQHIQLVVDRFTKYIVAYPVSNLEADQTSNDFVEKVCLQWGPPTFLQTDNGPCYASKKFENMCQSLGIAHVFSSPYRPKSNGHAERYVKTLSTGIKTFCYDNNEDWDKIIPYLVHSLNSTVSASTGFSPHFMLTSTEPTKIADNLMAVVGPRKTHLQHVIDMIKKLDTANKVAKSLNRQQTLRQQHYHDRNAHQTKIKRESIVYIKIERLLDREKSRKLQEVYSGPYVVCAFNSPHTVLVKSLQTLKMAPRPVHVDRLKLVTQVRKNDFLKRLVDHNDNYFKRYWKVDKGTLRPTRTLLSTQTTQPRPSHSKIEKRSLPGTKA